MLVAILLIFAAGALFLAAVANAAIDYHGGTLDWSMWLTGFLFLIP